MPLPPAMPRWWRRACGSSGTKNRPCGAMTLMVSPGLRCSLIQLEKTPPLTLRTPTRSSPSSTPAQIEYERRRSLPSMVVRKVRYWPWVKPKTSRRSGGTWKETMTASCVSGSMERTRSGWKIDAHGIHSAQLRTSRADGARHVQVGSTRMVGSDRLEIFERLAAGAAAVERLAGGGTESGQPLGVRARAPRAGRRRFAPAHEPQRDRRHPGRSGSAARCRIRAACAVLRR